MALGDFTAIKSIVTLSAASDADWTAQNPVLPVGYPGWVTDLKKMKVGDGVTPWNSLGFTVDQSLTESQKALLDNAGGANGVCVLDAGGLVPLSVLPDQAKTHIVYVADIAARDAWDAADRHYVFVVLDATADPLVDVGAATYAWDSAANAGAGEWIKLSEFESMDIDFSVFFNKTTETLDDINDGTNYIRFTPAEREKLAKAMVTDETYHFKGLTPAELTTALA